MPLNLNRDLLQKGVYRSDKTFSIKIKLLDNTVVNLALPQKARGRECLEKIAQSLGLQEVIRGFSCQRLQLEDEL